MQAQDAEMMIYSDYPTYGFLARVRQKVHFRLAGDGRLIARLMIAKTGRQQLPELVVKAKGSKDALSGKKVAGGSLEYEVPGDAEITINWRHGKKDRNLQQADGGKRTDHWFCRERYGRLALLGICPDRKFRPGAPGWVYLL
jgi:hypothetical protein